MHIYDCATIFISKQADLRTDYGIETSGKLIALNDGREASGNCGWLKPWVLYDIHLVRESTDYALFTAGGIGRKVAIDLARNGYAVVVAGKTTSDASKCVPFPPDPNSQKSTINTVVGSRQ